VKKDERDPCGYSKEGIAKRIESGVAGHAMFIGIGDKSRGPQFCRTNLAKSRSTAARNSEE
jgi:hypothetical protein